MFFRTALLCTAVPENTSVDVFPINLEVTTYQQSRTWGMKHAATSDHINPLSRETMILNPGSFHYRRTYLGSCTDVSRYTIREDHRRLPHCRSECDSVYDHLVMSFRDLKDHLRGRHRGGAGTGRGGGEYGVPTLYPARRHAAYPGPVLKVLMWCLKLPTVPLGDIFTG